MDVAGSFLELACVRVALLPAGTSMPDHRFEELTSHLTSFREIPVNALPRRAAVPRTAGNATFSSMPTDFREALAHSSSSSSLHRSQSMSRDVGRPPTAPTSPTSPSITALRKTFAAQTDSPPAQRNFSSTRVAPHAVSFRKTRAPIPVSPRHSADLDMTRPDVDCSFRLRYDIVHRDHAGALIMKPFSEWDEFHSSKIWGVFGIVDCTQPGICDNAEERQRAILHAYDDFNAALPNFKHAAVRRLIIFIAPNTDHETGPFVLNDPKQSVKDAPFHFSVGYVPEHEKRDETRLEVKAQIIHFSGLLLHAIDRDCWRKRESSATEIFRSPIDEKHIADRQSKLAKRRAGRLDKLLGDSLLLMGSPSEALVKYNSAIEKAKANSDRLFLAGAMEGWSAARVLTYVGNGGSVSDPSLSDELIEHYAEIYKLYQKKRVAEPEAAAALRLAEFLGKWGNRRKDALDAAEHAATVGEGLKVQKLAALWEALARFSERMGCRRKAALFLYRLGLLNGKMSVWSSAVTLMIACERQLSRDGKKPWASLNRNVILSAAHYADEAGDVSTATRLYAEALVITPRELRDGRQADENIITALVSSQAPPYLPAAKDMVYLQEIVPLQLHDLSIHRRNSESSELESEAVSKGGPFIYDPFEAKKRAKAAAVAQRAVTWVCDEPAYISAHLVSRIGADLIVDVIAVVLAEHNSDEEEVLIDEGKFSKTFDSVATTSNEDETSHSEYTKYIRRMLGHSNQMAETIPDSFTVPSRDVNIGITKQITVVPKRMGALHVRGLIVRLFNEAIVTLRTNCYASGEAPPVSVICNLPRIDISSHSVEGGSMESISNGAPLVVYEGERRVFRIRIRNTGVDNIVWMKAKVRSSNPDFLAVSSRDLLENDIWNGLEEEGNAKFFDVEVLGKPRRKKKRDGSGDNEDSVHEEFSRRTALSIISVSVEYEGGQSSGTIRESTCFIRILSKPAVRVASILVLRSPTSVPSHEVSTQTPSYCIALEISNDTGAPAAVKVAHSSNSEKTDNLAEVRSDPHNSLGTECFVECGASARLICPLSDDTTHRLRETREDTENETHSRTEDIVFAVKWRLPALGRFGELDISHWDIWNALIQGRSRELPDTGSFSSSSCAQYHLMQAELNISLGEDLRQNKKYRTDDGSDKESSARNVSVGRFRKASIHVQNLCTAELPKGTRLDIDLLQIDDRGCFQKVHRAVVVGAVEKVDVGHIQPLTGTFDHSVLFKVHSTGIFHLQACLYTENVPDSTLPATNSSDNPAMSLPKISSSKTKTRSNAVVPGNPPSATDNTADNTGYSSAIGPATGSKEVTPIQDMEKLALSRQSSTQTDKEPSLILLSPTTIDSYPETVFKSTRGEVLACSVLQFLAVPNTVSASASRSSPVGSL